MTEITREDVAKAILSTMDDAVRRDEPLTDVWIDGYCDLLAVADAVMLLLYAPARIDDAVAKERERCAGIADEEASFAGLADSHVAEVAEDTRRKIARRIASVIRTPTPTPEEGA